jgi:hypothetical protein
LVTQAFHGLVSARSNPNARPGRPSGHTHVGRWPHRQVAAAAARHTGQAGRLVRSRIQIELRGNGARGGGGASGGWRHGRERVASRGGDAHRGGAPRRGRTARGEGRTSARPSWPAAGDTDARVLGRGGGSRRASHRGGVRRGRARRGEAVATTEEER